VRKREPCSFSFNDDMNERLRELMGDGGAENPTRAKWKTGGTLINPMQIVGWLNDRA